MHYFDFHTHSIPQESNITALVSSPNRLTTPYWSQESHPWYPENMVRAEDIMYAQAVGEVGLDRLRGAELSVQIKRLGVILKRANELNKPVIFHSVRATAELLEAVKPYPKLVKVFHGFNGKKELLEQLLHHDFVVTLGENFLRDKSYDLDISLQGNIGLESDNSALSIIDIYNKFETIYGTKFRESFEQTFFRLFGGNHDKRSRV